MKQINVYEIGVDPLPVEGSSIAIIDRKTSFAMFEEHNQKVGVVEYDSGLFLDDGTEIFEGCLWMYEHEYLPVISDIEWPFQEWNTYQTALSENWCNEINSVEDEKWFDHPEKGVKVKWINKTVLFNNKKFNVEWVCHKINDKVGFSMMGWE